MQCVEDVNQLGDIARRRPRANLVKGLLQEDSRVRELQQENRELQSFLNEYQTALDIVMNKYREQVFRLMMSNKLDRSAKQRQALFSAEVSRNRSDAGNTYVSTPLCINSTGQSLCNCDHPTTKQIMLIIQ